MKIYGVGRVAKDFEIDYSPKGICILKFPFAENIFDRKTKEKKAQYYNVVVFGRLAEIMGDLGIQKGDKMQIEGNINISEYTTTISTYSTIFINKNTSYSIIMIIIILFS